MNIQTLPMHRFLDHHGKIVKPLPKWADKSTLTHFYRSMVLTRVYDNKAVSLQRTGKLGTYPSHLGSEAIGIAIGNALYQDDIFIPYYRDMPAMWVRGISMEKNLQYWGGDERGSAFPPINDNEKNYDMPFCVPIATQYTHAVGIAVALKIRKTNNAALVTCGDGATSKGDFFEALNCAGVWKIPVIFVINNNQWAISVPRNTQCHAPLLSDKAKGAGIAGITVDGNDVIAMYDIISQCLEDARKGKGPTLIEAISYRLSDHTTADDASRYRSDAEVKEAWNYEPISRLKQFLINQNWWSEEEEDKWLVECQSQVGTSVQNYLNMTEPAPETGFDYLYESLDPELKQQRDDLINKAMRMNEK